MPLKIKIISEHRDLVGDDYVREYHEEGGTIGRCLLYTSDAADDLLQVEVSGVGG